MPEHSIVVVLDVTAPDRITAARAAVGILNGTRGARVLPGGVLADTILESWWFPEADLKQVDRNDNAAMHLIRDDDTAVDECIHEGCSECAGHAAEANDRQVNP